MRLADGSLGDGVAPGVPKLVLIRLAGPTRKKVPSNEVCCKGERRNGGSMSFRRLPKIGELGSTSLDQLAPLRAIRRGIFPLVTTHRQVPQITVGCLVRMNDFSE